MTDIEKALIMLKRLRDNTPREILERYAYACNRPYTKAQQEFVDANPSLFQE